MLKKLKLYLSLFLAPVLVSLLSVHFLILEGYPYGHDWIFELVRIREYSEALVTGQLLPYWSNNLYKGFGAPVFTFYAPLYSLISSVFFLAGTSITNAAIITIVLLSLVTSISITFLMREIIENDQKIASNAAVRISTVAYLLSPYLLANFMLRNASAEYSAMCLLPIPLLGLARIYNGKNGFLHLAIGVALIILAHNLTALILAAIVFVLAFLLYIPSKEYQKLKITLLSLFAGIGLTTWFWLPAFGLKSYVRVTELQVGKLAYENNFKLLYELFGYSYFFSIGLFSFLVLIIGIITLKDAKYFRLKLYLVTASLFFIFLQIPASLFFWNNIPFMPLFQFPWRMMGPFSIIIAVLTGILFRCYVKRVRLAEIILVILITLNAIPHFIKSKPLPEDVSINIESITTPKQIRNLNLPVTVGDEYLPATANIELINNFSNEEIILFDKDIAEVKLLQDKGTFIRFSAESKEQINLKILRWYFPGWQLEVNGENYPFIKNKNGLLEFILPAGQHEVIAILTQTHWRLTGYLVSFVFIILLLPLFRFNQRITTS